MAQRSHKYLFVVGGVMSGVGKGVATASMGTVLQAKGFSVNPVKVDPYLNVDAGTMNPTEHGEVFVLASGLECDQDMGNYERFINTTLPRDNYLTSGMIYQDVIQRERNLGYRGKCVEAIPHIRDEIIGRWRSSAEQSGADVSIIEIGGTIGDYQNVMFLEAARVMQVQDPDDVRFVMVSYLPVPSKVGEMKTRPTQNAVRQLNSYGIQPDMLIGRSELSLDKKRKEKIAIACNVPASRVISAPDIESIYDVPLNFERDKLGDMLLEELKVRTKRSQPALTKWRRFVSRLKRAEAPADIAIVGKYFDTGDFVLTDAYISVIEAIKYAGAKHGVDVRIHWLNAKQFERGEQSPEEVAAYDGIIVPGGFGESGIEGKLAVIKYAREHDIPYFGLCYGMQLLCVEYARNVLGLSGANTAEIDPQAEHPIVVIMNAQQEVIAKGQYGGTMRLGEYPAELAKGSIAAKAYGTARIEHERHRHRFEINPAYVEQLQQGGLRFSGTSPDGSLMEIAELPREHHPFYVGTQFHPEFTARPLEPNPLFSAFVKATRTRHNQRTSA